MAKHKAKHDAEVQDAPETEDAPVEESIYRGHGVTVVRQAQPNDPDYPRGADPTTVALVADWRGMHHSVNVAELEPPLDPYPPPPEPPAESKKEEEPEKVEENA